MSWACKSASWELSSTMVLSCAAAAFFCCARSASPACAELSLADWATFHRDPKGKLGFRVLSGGRAWSVGNECLVGCVRYSSQLDLFSIKRSGHWRDKPILAPHQLLIWVCTLSNIRQFEHKRICSKSGYPGKGGQTTRIGTNPQPKLEG